MHMSGFLICEGINTRKLLSRMLLRNMFNVSQRSGVKKHAHVRFHELAGHKHCFQKDYYTTIKKNQITCILISS